MIIVDLLLLAGVLFAILNQMQTRKKVKKLQNLLSDMEPAFERFSSAIDRSETTIETMRESAEEVARRLNKEASDVEKRVRLMNGVNNAVPDLIPGNPSLFRNNASKSSMINQIFNTARARS